LLLYFKRGNPAGPARGKQAPSIYREPKREHSRKPDYFRHMINQFTGGQDVLELFARVDAEHPLPANFAPWGNQITAHDAKLAQPSASAACPHQIDVDPLAPEAFPADDSLDLPNFLRIGHPECECWRKDSSGN
jgi:hypothetical protein